MVKRAVEEVQQARAGKAAGVRTSKSPLLDPYEETIRDLLRRYPRITATRLLEELHSAGYQGSYTILRQRLKQLRVPTGGKPVETRQRGQDSLIFRFESVILFACPDHHAQTKQAGFTTPLIEETLVQISFTSKPTSTPLSESWPRGLIVIESDFFLIS